MSAHDEQAILIERADAMRDADLAAAKRMLAALDARRERRETEERIESFYNEIGGEG